MRRAVLLFIFINLALLTPAYAASMKFCWDDASTVGATKVSAYATNPTTPTVTVDDDLLPGSSVTSGKRCNIAPFPAPLVRNVDYSVTLRQTNAAGEEGTASNVVPFRFPLAPTAPTGVTVVPAFP